MSEFWSLWIIVLTAVTLVLVTWLLFVTRRMKQLNDDNTTGHNFDGIIEEDNPLPQWWLILFVITIVFGIGYLVVFPGLGNYQGLIAWSSASEHEESVNKVAERFSQSMDEFSLFSFDQLVGNEKAVKAGRRLYVNNCSVCHGANATGAIGFPNLSDSSWQWGGSKEQVIQSITLGRQAAMPAWESVLSETQIGILVEYLLFEAQAEFAQQAHGSDSHAANDKKETQATGIAYQGKQLYMTYCIACHGDAMQGNVALGAPSLVDQEWLYGASLEDVKQSIALGRNGVMPAHNDLLGKEKIKLVAAFILSLSATQNDGIEND